MGQKVRKPVDGGRRHGHFFHCQHGTIFPLDRYAHPTFLAFGRVFRIEEEVCLELSFGQRQGANIPLDECRRRLPKLQFVAPFPHRLSLLLFMPCSASTCTSKNLARPESFSCQSQNKMADPSTAV